MLAYYVDAVRRAAEEKARLEGLVEAEARKPRVEGGGSTPCAASRGRRLSAAADLVFRPASSPGSGTPGRSPMGRPDALPSTPAGERPQGRDHQGGNKHLRKALVEAAWHYLTCSGAAEGPRQGGGPGPGRPKSQGGGWWAGGRPRPPGGGGGRHAAKGVMRRLDRGGGAPLPGGAPTNKEGGHGARPPPLGGWAAPRPGGGGQGGRT